MAQLDTLAYELGQKLEDFLKWYGNLDFMIRSHAKMRTVRESYYRGVQDRVNMNGEVNRLCIFIQGKPNVGKTYAAEKALKGKQVLKIGGGGTGKFDRLLPSHDAIIVDDDTVVKNLLNMTDNYMHQVYKRQKNNPYWCGEYFIVISHLPFEEWVKRCGIPTQEYGIETEQYRTIKSRFYICHIGETEDKKTRVLMCTSPSTRGSKEDQKARLAKYIEFRKKVNESLTFYASQGKIDYSKINGEWKESSTPEEIQQPQSKNNDPYAGWTFLGRIDKDDIAHFEAKGYKMTEDGKSIIDSKRRAYYEVALFY